MKVQTGLSMRSQQLRQKRNNRDRNDPVLTPAQLRMARAALGWGRERLAAKSGTSAETIKNFEARESNPTLATVNKWRKALINGGVIFFEEDENYGPGVRLKKKS